MLSKRAVRSVSPVLVGFGSAALLVAICCLLFPPTFATNDDVAMSMIAHGYGLAEYASPQLVFSNVLWGHLIRAVPDFADTTGYSWVVLAVLIAISGSLLSFLLLDGVSFCTALLAVILVVMRPVMFPQFTVNAGLLAVAAVLGWRIYANHSARAPLILASLLLLASFLLRDLESLLVLGVALPLLPWQHIRLDRRAQVVMMTLAVAMATASIYDGQTYKEPEWQRFAEFNSARKPFTDYGAGPILKARPDLLERFNFSRNDIDLVSSGFNVDPKVSDAQALSAMTEQLEPAYARSSALASGGKALTGLASRELWPLVAAALFLLLLVPHPRLLLAWGFCLVALFLMGVMGRPGIVRVYVPLVSLLAIAPLLCADGIGAQRKRFALAILAVGVAVNTYLCVQDAKKARINVENVQLDLHRLPRETIVSWADGFPYEAAYPLLGNAADQKRIRIYGLDTLTYAPFSVAVAEEKAGRSVRERLLTTDGVPILAFGRVHLAHLYCSEHFGGEVGGAATFLPRGLSVWRLRCELPPR